MSHFDMTYTTGCRDKKVFAMNLLGSLGTAYRVIWGISRFVGMELGTWHPHPPGNKRYGPCTSWVLLGPPAMLGYMGYLRHNRGK